MWATLKGLAAAVLGGFGSLPGAVAGGLALGLAEAALQALFGAPARELGGDLLLFLVLCLCPGGLVSLLPGRRTPGAHPFSRAGAER
ncbi:MAG: hypothetical protein VB138_04980 [Burkholderia sp.]